jgi:hypothetical protein
MAVSPKDDVPRPDLKAIRADQDRRVEAKKDLIQALQSYTQTLSCERDADQQELAAIWGPYAEALYDSLAETYQGLAVDPDTLFGEAGVLAGGQTMADVQNDLKKVRVGRPDQWPATRDPLADGSVSFAWLADEPWFLDEVRNRLSAGARHWKDTQASTKGAMIELPKLPERIARLHVLRWNALIKSHGFIGDHLEWHESRDRCHRAAKPAFSLLPPPTASLDPRSFSGRAKFYDAQGEEISYEEWKQKQLAAWAARETDPKIIDSIGIAETVALAEARLADIACDYLAVWADANGDSDQFAQWSEGLRHLVVSEVSGVWQRDKWHADWFERACRSQVDEHLTKPVDEWKSRASALEIQHLENPDLSLRSLLDADGDVISARLQKGDQVIQEAQRLLDSLDVPSPAGGSGTAGAPGGASAAHAARPQPEPSSTGHPLWREGEAMTTVIPYKYTKEFIEAKSRIPKPMRARLDPGPGEPRYSLEDEVAMACAYMDRATKLHKEFLGAVQLSAPEGREALKDGICDAMEEVMVRGGYSQLVRHRDALIERECPTSGSGTKDATADPPSWKSLQAEFLQYAVEHADLSAVWMWVYTHADQAAGQPPQGKWTFRGGSPSSQHLFRAIAGRAAGLLTNSSGAEPWRRWLDLMRKEGYARKIALTRVSGREFKTAAESGEFAQLPPGFESEQIENVFKSSADFCYVHSLAGSAPTLRDQTASPTAAEGSVEKLAPPPGDSVPLTASPLPEVAAAKDDPSNQTEPNDNLVTPAAQPMPDHLRILADAINNQGLNPPKLAEKMQAILKRDKKDRDKADRTTVYRIVQGETKKPQPAIREALIEALELNKEQAAIVRRGLGAL